LSRLPTISEAIAEAAARIRNAGQTDERRAARLLLANALGIDQTQLLVRSGDQLDGATYDIYLGMVARRAAGEPLQHITGRQEFYGLDFVVTPDVLIPRPETEFVVEQVLGLAEKVFQLTPLIVDIGTGSGCIAVALARGLPAARLVGTDISAAALYIARKNAERNGVDGRIEFLEGDLFQALEGKGIEGSVDIIATNPPYVPANRPDSVERQVRDYEPALALFGGEDGLMFYSRLLERAPTYLKLGGYLVCEIGYSQLDAVRDIIDRTAFELVEVTSDLQGIPRTLTVRHEA
jgi:release factor glutamine methyltransferase